MFKDAYGEGKTQLPTASFHIDGEGVKKKSDGGIDGQPAKRKARNAITSWR